jgi:hypothetical protein
LRLALRVGGLEKAESGIPAADYFATFLWSEEFITSTGQSYVLANWHRPLPAMIDAFTAPGFRITMISELLPGFLKDKPPGSGFLCFMVFVLEAA